MRDNQLRTRWQAGQTAYSAWVATDSPYVAEVVASVDFDAVVVDLQHGVMDVAAAVGMFQAISAHAPTPLARVPANEPGIIMKLLDAGAYGIICPLVNSAAECEQFVQACRYPPQGVRSYGPSRGFLYGGADYFQKANETIVTLAMVETVSALNNLAGIVAVEGLDAVFIGPSDLSISMGYPPGSEFHQAVIEDAIETVRRTSQDAGRQVGIFCHSGEHARRRAEQGFDLVIIGADATHIKVAHTAALSTARGG